MVGRIALVLALSACERPQLAAQYQLDLGIDESLLRPRASILTLRIDTEGDNHVDLCVRSVAADLRIASLTFEKDATEAYHLRVNALDSALNDGVLEAITSADLPTSLLGRLTPFEIAIAAVLRNSQYVLRFCRPKDDGRLSCQSPLGIELNTWSEVSPSEGCTAPPTCALPDIPAILPPNSTVDQRTLHCLTNGGKRSLCEALAVGPSEVFRCVFDAPLDVPTVREGCNQVDKLVREGTTLTNSICDGIPLCEVLDETLSTAKEEVVTQCAKAGEVFDAIARCCPSDAF